MKIIFALCLSAFISSCATQNPLPQSQDPFDQKTITDVRPVTNSNDLKQLMKSLPVWEFSDPKLIDTWIRDMGELTGDTLKIDGDGAQVQLRLTKLASPGHFELEVGSEDWPEGGHSLHTLKRIGEGWQVLPKATS